MAGGASSQIAWEPLRSLAAPFTGAYQAVGTPFVNPSYICKLVNNSSVLVTISVDGVNDVDVAPANSFWLYDESKFGPPYLAQALPAGTKIFIKGTGGAGSVYVATQYIV